MQELVSKVAIGFPLLAATLKARGGAVVSFMGTSVILTLRQRNPPNLELWLRALEQENILCQ
jgi:hypothetical protein